MSNPLIDFESSRVRDQQRLEVQQARKAMLDESLEIYTRDCHYEKSYNNYRRSRSRSHDRCRSPKSKRKLLKPGDKLVEKNKINDVAVWEKKSILPSSSGHTSGGWKKKLTTEIKNSEDSYIISSQTTLNSENPIKIFTDKELNQLGAKLVKAELVGNQVLADKLKKKLEKARENSQKAIKEKMERKHSESKEEEVLLTATNSQGFTRPVTHAEDRGASGKSRKKAKVSSQGADGQRDKYFPDDNKFSLRDMFENEKLGTSSESDAMFVRAAARANKATLDDDYTLDDSFVDKSVGREDVSSQNSRDRMKAIMDHQKREKALANCYHCLDSSKLEKHLIISLGSKSYLALPSRQSLVTGHCLIVPREHVATSTLIDEDTWNEMNNYRKSLVKYFSSQDLDVLFLECCMRLSSHPHTVVHCVPLPREMGDLAPIYYKKAIQESESEWSQNIKLVDLKGRDVRRAVPKGFPYFAVDFGSESGYAHVIEDEQTFPSYFGLSIVGGMLDIEPQLWRKPKNENFDAQRRKVLAFSKEFQPFDPEES